MPLSAAEQRLLLHIARDSIVAGLERRALEVPPDLPPALREPRGVFVTLHRHGRLRGCIGYLEAVRPLAQAVAEMAQAAAFQDPRFAPLTAPELPEVELEISVLTPMRRIQDIQEIEVGRHGLYIERGPCRGLLLPQVATECRWDRLTFLEQTCCKAGLPPSAWKDPETRIYVFDAEVFAEAPHAGAAKESPQP
jgi:AmmeMemoRadiSam system protein A